jgi:Flp pilus assembly pilin Flp
VNNNMIIAYLQALLAQVRREEGQTAVEYGLVIAVIAVAIVVALAALLTGVAGDIATKVTDAIAGA